jgi:signal peptidase I
MFSHDTAKISSKKSPGKNRAVEVANAFESMIIALILALIFMEFVMQAFRIPTGSMADTLRGAHFRLCCPQCGYRYNYGFIPERYGFDQDIIPSSYLNQYTSRCPSCGCYQPTGGNMPVAGGDRILVLKCLYQFFEPKRWDVVVFENPLNPRINFIKRLIGKPGEEVEIIDGDIYIDGQISRKPPKVQEGL